MSEMKTIELTNVGPIPSLEIPIPPEGGCVVLRGRNGAGKSTALEAIRLAAGGRAKLSARDGSGKGTVEAFGATVTVAASQRKKGTAEVVSLEGRGDVAALVDPGIADAEKADAARVRALVALSGRQLSEADFRRLLSPEEWDAVVGQVPPGDPLEIGGRVKRAIEAAARKSETAADESSATAATLLRQNEGLDLSGPSDSAALAEAYADARTRLAEVRAAIEPARRARAARDEAARTLAEMPTAEELAARLAREKAIGDQSAASRAAARKVEDDLQAEIARAAEALKVLESRRVDMQVLVERADSEMRVATMMRENTEREIAARKKIADAAAAEVPDEPDAAELERYAVAVAQGKAAMDAGGAIREAKRRVAQAGEHVGRANVSRKAAERLRAAAAGVDGVLTGLVSDLCAAIRIEDGRLVVTTTRGRTLFGELSHGERWRLALEFAIGAVGRGGVLVCPQEAWEGLDPGNREMVAELLTGSGVVMFTAACSDRETIGVEVMT